MVSRVVLLLHIMIAKNVFFVLEQPSSSVMQFHPRLQQLFSRFRLYKCFTWLGAFGGGSPKPTVLNSAHDFVLRLYRPLDREQLFSHGHLMTKHYVDATGAKRCTGGSHLKLSQAYPRGFGEALRELYVAEAPELRRAPWALQPTTANSCVGDPWDDAGIQRPLQCVGF